MHYLSLIHPYYKLRFSQESNWPPMSSERLGKREISVFIAILHAQEF
jgi:hypothetical protein